MKLNNKDTSTLTRPYKSRKHWNKINEKKFISFLLQKPQCKITALECKYLYMEEICKCLFKKQHKVRTSGRQMEHFTN